MAGSVNKVILVGNLGRDPEARNMQSGSKVVSFSIATSETWNDKASGERQTKTTWHRIAIFNEKLGEIAERFLKKGSKVYLEGRIETRKYTDKEGAEKEITEVIIPRFGGELTLLDSRSEGGEQREDSGQRESRGGGGAARGGYGGGGQRSGGGAARGGGGGGYGGGAARGAPPADMDDDIPFSMQWQ